MSGKKKNAPKGQQKAKQEQKEKNKVIWIAAAVVCICVIAAICIAVSLRKPASEGAQGEAGGTYADIDIEDYGTVTLQLDSAAAPVTVENFVNLAESGFYDGLTFHRIMEGFMMQGGDPLGNGTGGSEQTIEGEFSANGHENNLSHVRGTVSMARSNDYNSASSQFFIVQQDSTFLDGQYAAFGTVTEGMDIVDEICQAVQPTDDNGTIVSEDQPVIRTITIRTE